MSDSFAPRLARQMSFNHKCNSARHRIAINLDFSCVLLDHTQDERIHNNIIVELGGDGMWCFEFEAVWKANLAGARAGNQRILALPLITSSMLAGVTSERRISEITAEGTRQFIPGVAQTVFKILSIAHKAHFSHLYRPTPEVLPGGNIPLHATSNRRFFRGRRRTRRI